jgi:ATP-dependent exoDNAse (exonuclease V) beta subunit
MDNSRVIFASAGTGKTYRLSVEILSLLFKEENLKDIVAVTFTKKATMEIKTRIVMHLQDLIDVLEGKKNKKETIYDILIQNHCEIDIDKARMLKRNLLENKKDFHIYTIDAFINSIFSKLIAPYLHIEEFSLIDNAFNEEIIEEVFLSIFNDNKAKKNFDILIKLNTRIKNLSRYKSFVEFAIDNRFLLEKTSEDNSFQTVTILDIIISIKKIMDLMNNTVGYYKDFINKTSPFSSFDLSCTEKDFKSFIEKNYKSIFRIDNFWHKKKCKEIHEELQAQYTEFKFLLADYLYSKRIVPFINESKSIFLEIFARYDKIKLTQKKFTYQDISYYTYKYLYSDPDSLIDLEKGEVLNFFYEVLSARIKHFLIDEFQDTSVVQWNILLPLIKELSSSAENTVICVGDEKQAIYGWRGGESALLISLVDILDIDKPESLSVSYRSSKNVVNFVNSFFQGVSSEINWKYSFVDCHNKDISGYVEFIIEKIEKNKKEQIDKMIERISNLIKEEKILPSSTVILFRTNKDMELASMSLREKRIKFVIDSASSILDHRAIKPIIYLLEYKIYKETPFLFDFLRSEYLQYSLFDLDIFLRMYKENEENFYQMEPIKSIVIFLNDLEEDIPLEQVIIRILVHFDVANLFSDIYDHKNIRRFVEIIIQLSNDNSDVINISTLLKELKKRKKTDSFRQIALESSDVLQLMTIHKAKGLEFETVFFLWDLSVKEGNYSDEYTMFYSYNNVFTSLDQSLICFSEDEVIVKNFSSTKKLYEEKQKKNLIEDINNIYVAMTRAKNNLFVYCFLGKKIEDIEKINDISEKNKDNLYYLLKCSLSKVFSSNSNNVFSLSEIEKKSFVLGQLDILPNNEISHKSVQNLEYINLNFLSSLKIFQRSDHQYDNKLLQTKSNYTYKQLLGSLTHDYLSAIYYDLDTEHQKAKNIIYSKYGAFYSKKELDGFIEKCIIFVKEKSEIFQVSSLVFNEHILFEHSKEYRADRIMIDETTKQVLIIDYKTGVDKDPKQLDCYKRIVQNILGENYCVRAKIIEV